MNAFLENMEGGLYIGIYVPAQSSMYTLQSKNSY